MFKHIAWFRSLNHSLGNSNLGKMLRPVIEQVSLKYSTTGIEIEPEYIGHVEQSAGFQSIRNKQDCTSRLQRIGHAGSSRTSNRGHKHQCDG